MHTFKHHIQEAFKSKRFKQNISSDMVEKIIEGPIDISCLGLKSILEFRDYSNYIVIGNFDCSVNGLTDLKGAPKEVRGIFWCNRNDLTSLRGGPQKVEGLYDCSDNMLVSLEGIPSHVGGRFECRGNPTGSCLSDEIMARCHPTKVYTDDV